MQAVLHADGFGKRPAAPSALASALAPADMAGYLRRVDPLAALCFAQAMYDRVAWANEDWGAYWAAVVDLV